MEHSYGLRQICSGKSCIDNAGLVRLKNSLCQNVITHENVLLQDQQRLLKLTPAFTLGVEFALETKLQG